MNASLGSGELQQWLICSILVRLLGDVKKSKKKRKLFQIATKEVQSKILSVNIGKRNRKCLLIVGPNQDFQ